MTAPVPSRIECPPVEVGILTWNVLADAYLQRDRYPDLSESLRNHETRGRAIAQIVAEASRDVIALQEAEPALAEELSDALGGNWTIRWCPRGRNRPDGCLTAVRRRWTIIDDVRMDYQVGSEPTGDVAHILTIENKGRSLTIANTHLPWVPPGTPRSQHRGARQARALANRLADMSSVVVVAGDVNDGPAGPVRQVLTAAGWSELVGHEPTALIRGEPRLLDLIAVRGAAGRAESRPVPMLLTGSSIPSWDCPSDHVPVTATVVLGREHLQ